LKEENEELKLELIIEKETVKELEDRLTDYK